MVDLNLDIPIARTIAEGIITAIDERSVSAEEMMEDRLSHRKLDIVEKRIESNERLGQMAVNKESAKHPSLLIAGARPVVIWICAGALAWNYILYPILSFLAWLFPEYREVMDSAPKQDYEELKIILGGLLGFGGYRTVEKFKGIDTKSISLDGLPDIKIFNRNKK